MELEKATIQELNLELIKKTKFNGFNGAKVVKSLLKNCDLWQSVVMDRTDFVFASDIELKRKGSKETISLIKLRDMQENFWNVDTLFILPKGGNVKEIVKLARREWYADEVTVIRGKQAEDWLGMGGFGNLEIVKVWWD